MAGYSTKDVTANPGAAISGVVTNQVASLPFPITAGGSLNFVLKLAASSVTVAGAITAKLQTAIGGDWVDSKTVSVTGNGNFYIKLNVQVSGDQTFLPLLNQGRLVITTSNAGDTLTIDAINVLQEL